MPLSDHPDTPDDDRDAPKSPLERITGGFVPAPLPPIAHDGGLAFDPAPVAALKVAPVSRCTLGPCKNLHTLETKIENQDPLDGSPGQIFTVVTSTCYPSIGVEVDLSGHPVRECSRWIPMADGELFQITTARSNYADKHRAQMAAFEESWAGATKGDE